ncbi:MAG: flippase-like domain-containing protein [Chloroflexi bacterium]|nr:flippase-like domain-containing protein [Chloroflexota bacterium]
MKLHLSRRWLDGAALLLGLLLFWIFARQVDWGDGLSLLRRIGPTPFLIYLAVNGGIAVLFAVRWWLLLTGMGVYLPFGRVVVYRMIAATVSLLTPGPQFGGEPAQVYLLVRHSGVAAPQAIAAVALDRLLELAVNLAFLTGGILYTLWTGVLGAALDGRVILLALIPLSLPPLLLFSFWWRGRFLTIAAEALLRQLPERWQPRSPTRLVESLRGGEAHIHTILRQNPRLVAIGALVSLGNWLVLLADFWLATRLIGLQLDVAQFIGFVVAARIAILLPIPAGLGALEASQILAAQRLGLNPALGLGLVLLFRVRDVALALGGLGLAWRERKRPALLLQPAAVGRLLQPEEDR